MNNEITLTVGSSRLAGWKEVSINKSMDTLCSSFRFSMVDVWEGEPIALVPQLDCIIAIDGKKIITGYIDNVDIQTSEDDHILSITGRDKTGDLVDCSADHKPGTWKKIDLQKLVYELVRPFGLRVYMDAQSERVKEFSVGTGASVFECIQEVCIDRGILPLSNVDGDILLTNTGYNRSVDKLIYGENIQSANITYDFTERFSKYKVKGQKSGEGDGWTTTTTEISGEALDSAISRYRPKVISADGQLTSSLALKRAAWEAQTRAGRSGKLTVTIPTWKQSDGSLWEINTLVACKIPPLRISPDAPLLLHEIEYVQDNDRGTYSVMKLIRGDAYSPEPKKSVKTSERSKNFGMGW
jgi:prophage tail gpP-like protein